MFWSPCTHVNMSPLFIVTMSPKYQNAKLTCHHSIMMPYYHVTTVSRCQVIMVPLNLDMMVNEMFHGAKYGLCCYGVHPTDHSRHSTTSRCIGRPWSQAFSPLVPLSLVLPANKTFSLYSPLEPSMFAFKVNLGYCVGINSLYILCVIQLLAGMAVMGSLNFNQMVIILHIDKIQQIFPRRGNAIAKIGFKSDVG